MEATPAGVEFFCLFSGEMPRGRPGCGWPFGTCEAIRTSIRFTIKQKIQALHAQFAVREKNGRHFSCRKLEAM
jgi:hypothetical protein